MKLTNPVSVWSLKTDSLTQNNISLFLCLAILIVATLSIFSCKHTPDPVPPTPPSPTPNIDTAKDNIGKIGLSLTEHTTKIDEEVKKAETDTQKIEQPKTLIPVLMSYYQNIYRENNAIKNLNIQLEQTKALLNTSNLQVRALEDTIKQLGEQNKKLTEEKEKLEKEKGSLLNSLLTWLSVIGVIGLGVCGALAFYGKMDLAIGGAVLCVTMVAAAIFVSKFMIWIAIGFGVVILILLGFMVYKFILKNKELFKLENISTELVATGEVAKLAMRKDARQYIFGNGPIPGQIDVIQSPETKKFVNNKRKAGKVKLAPSLAPVNIVDDDDDTQGS